MESTHSLDVWLETLFSVQSPSLLTPLHLVNLTDSIFADVLKIGEAGMYLSCVPPCSYIKTFDLEIAKNERPRYPPKILSVRIVDDPFGDIVPRITAAEKAAQKRAREEAQ